MVTVTIPVITIAAHLHYSVVAYCIYKPKNFENVGVMPVDCTQVLNLGWWEQRMDIPFEMESDYVQVG